MNHAIRRGHERVAVRDRGDHGEFDAPEIVAAVHGDVTDILHIVDDESGPVQVEATTRVVVASP